MAYLGDYIGHLLSEVTIGRMHADIEARRIAEIYENDPILKHFPVPRFRLPDVNIELPIIIDKIEELNTPNSIPRGGVYKRPNEDFFDDILKSIEKENGIKPGERLASKLKKNLVGTVNDLWKTSSVLLPKQIITKTLHKNVSKDLDKLKEKADKTNLKKIEKFENSLKKTIQEKISNLIQNPPRVKIRAISHEIKEHNKDEAMTKGAITKIKLSFKEESCEWIFKDNDGQIEQKLLPE